MGLFSTEGITPNPHPHPNPTPNPMKELILGPIQHHVQHENELPSNVTVYNA
jgi:hypothetical protein